MRKLLSNKLYLMLISVLIAFVMWVSVVSISNPDTTGSKAVTVEERNASAITSMGKAYTVLGNKTVKVNYKVQARDAYKVKSSDFRAYIDLSDIYDTTGTVRVVVQTVNNQDIISDCSSSPQTFQVVVEDIITKTVNVKVYTVDRCPDGYEAAASSTSLAQVDITGPESLINSIAVAGVEVSVKEATGTLSGNAALKFYESDDESARAVDVSNNKYFSASEYSTDYTLFINTVKTVPIQYEISGTPASGYHYSKSTASVESVVVTGNTDVVGQLSSIMIPSSVLDVDGATSNKSWNIDLNTYLPVGAVISGTHQTDITAFIDVDMPTTSGGPGVISHTTAATSLPESETAASPESSVESDKYSGGPGVTVPEPETVAEKQNETQESGESEKQTDAQTESQAQNQTELQTESQSHTQSEAATESRSHVQSEAVTENQSHTQSEAAAENRSHTQSEAATESQSHAQSEAATENQSHTQSEAAAENQPHGQSEAVIESQAQESEGTATEDQPHVQNQV